MVEKEGWEVWRTGVSGSELGRVAALLSGGEHRQYRAQENGE